MHAQKTFASSPWGNWAELIYFQRIEGCCLTRTRVVLILGKTISSSSRQFCARSGHTEARHVELEWLKYHDSISSWRCSGQHSSWRLRPWGSMDWDKYHYSLVDLTIPKSNSWPLIEAKVFNGGYLCEFDEQETNLHGHSVAHTLNHWQRRWRCWWISTTQQNYSLSAIETIVCTMLNLGISTDMSFVSTTDTI